MASSDLSQLLQEQFDLYGGLPVVGTTYKHISLLLPATAAASANNYDTISVVPFDGFLEEVVVNYTTVGGAGATLQIQRIQDTEANGAGDDLFVAPLSLTATANTRYTPALVPTDVRRFTKGDCITLVDAGTLTGLANLAIMLTFRVMSSPFVL